VRAVVREYSDPTLLPPASGAVSPAPTSRDYRASALAVGSVGVTSIRLRLVFVCLLLRLPESRSPPTAAGRGE
jgi:hypothetical protein